MAFVYFTEEQKQRANAVNLEQFLLLQGEKLLKSGREKRLASDHSITIRGNRWYDHGSAEGKGGCAIDFVQMYYGKDFPEAVTLLLNGEQGQAYPPSEARQPDPPKSFALPEAHTDMRRVYAYLTKTRGIDRDIITEFVRAKMIYEDVKYHNAIFVGYDAEGIPRHAHKRGTYTKGESFKGNVDSSNPRFSFHYTGTGSTVYVFEAPIDMLSFITMYQKDWKKQSYVSLCGVGANTLLQLLNDNPRIKKIGLCLDNDKAGREAGERLKRILADQGYSSVFSLVPRHKDWNEDLLEEQEYQIAKTQNRLQQSNQTARTQNQSNQPNQPKQESQLLQMA